MKKRKVKEKILAFSLSLEEYDELKKVADELDLTVSYFVRRAIEKFLKEKKVFFFEKKDVEKKKKGKKTVNFRISSNIYEELSKLAEQNEISVSGFVRFAVKNYINDLKNKKEILL